MVISYILQQNNPMGLSMRFEDFVLELASDMAGSKSEIRKQTNHCSKSCSPPSPISLCICDSMFRNISYKKILELKRTSTSQSKHSKI